MLVDIARKVFMGEPVDLATGFVNVIWQGDANACIIKALPLAASPPFVVNVTGTKILRVREVAVRFGRMFDKDINFVGSETNTAWLSNASKSRRLWGPPTIDEDELIEWVGNLVVEWMPHLGQTYPFSSTRRKVLIDDGTGNLVGWM